MPNSRAGVAVAAMVAIAAVAVGAWMWRSADVPAPRAAVAPIEAPQIVDAQPRASVETDTTWPPRAPAVAPAARPQVLLTGVAAAGPGHRLAIVSVDGSRQSVRRVGDALATGATVVAIDDRSLTYRHSGVDVRVPLQAPGVATTADAVAMAPPATRAESAVQAPAPQVAGAAPGSGNAAFRQAVARKMQALQAGA